MGRYKGVHPPRRDPPDHGVLFTEAARRISRSAGLLDAYRRMSGLHLRMIRTREAQASLAAAIERSISKFRSWHDDQTEAWEHAGRMAMAEYLGNWWTCVLRNDPPEALGQGDEWFSRETVREIVERFRDVIPDRAG